MKSYNAVVDVKYVVEVVQTKVVPKHCVPEHHLYWVQLLEPREADKLLNQALNHLFVSN